MAPTAVIIVSRNNPFLLGHAIRKYQEYSPGVPCDFYIIDAGSDNPAQDDLLARQKLAHVSFCENDRVEVNFDKGWRLFPHYDFYFFAHDDDVPIADDWLKPFVRRLEVNEPDPDAPEPFAKLPLGRVGALTHFWRNYHTVAGHPVQCAFLQPCIEIVTGQSAPQTFRYADCDRVLVSRQCLEATDGLVTLKSYLNKQQELDRVFHQYLGYPDDGMYPRSKYPAGYSWGKLTLLSEFMNSIFPLMNGFRTTGLDAPGYLEQIHGDDVPWANYPIAHYGSPNSVAALAKHFGTDARTIKSRLNDPIILEKTHRYLKQYYKDKT